MTNNTETIFTRDTVIIAGIQFRAGYSVTPSGKVVVFLTDESNPDAEQIKVSLAPDDCNTPVVVITRYRRIVLNNVRARSVARIAEQYLLAVVTLRVYPKLAPVERLPDVDIRVVRTNNHLFPSSTNAHRLRG